MKVLWTLGPLPFKSNHIIIGPLYTIPPSIVWWKLGGGWKRDKSSSPSYGQNSQLVQLGGLVHSGWYEVGRTRYMWMGSTNATTMVSYEMGLQWKSLFCSYTIHPAWCASGLCDSLSQIILQLLYHEMI
jgi:hypothetical protein